MMQRGEQALDEVYRAIRAVAADDDAAAWALELAVEGHAQRLLRGDLEPVLVRGVLLAAGCAPAPAFAAMTPANRAAVALARVARLDVDRIAAVLRVPRDVASARLRDGLRQVAAGACTRSLAA